MDQTILMVNRNPLNKTGIIRFTFIKLSFITGDFNSIADWIVSQILRKSNKSIIISHINLANYHVLLKDKDLLTKLVQKSQFIFDGIGLKIGAAICGHGLLPDLNGTDLFPLVLNKISDTQTKLFIIYMVIKKMKLF